MTIAIRSSATLAKTGSDSVTHTLTLPPTIVAGDRLVFVTSFDDSNNTITAGVTGWTNIFNGVRAVAYEKIADSTDAANAGTTFNVTSNVSDQSITAMHCISGAHASTASLYSLSEHGIGDGTTYPFAVCNGWTGEEALFISGVAWDRSSASTIPAGPTYSTGHTVLNAQDTSSGTGTASGITTQYQIVTASSLDPSDWTGSASRTATDFVIAIRPAGAPSTTGRNLLLGVG